MVEDSFPFGKITFQGRAVKLRGGIFLKLSDSNLQFKRTIRIKSSSNSKNKSLGNILNIPSSTSSQHIYVPTKKNLGVFLKVQKMMFIPPVGWLVPCRPNHKPSNDLPLAPKQSQDFGPGSELRFESRFCGWCFFPSVATRDEKPGVRRLPIAVGTIQTARVLFCWLLRENESPRDPSFIPKTKQVTTLIDTKPR